MNIIEHIMKSGVLVEPGAAKRISEMGGSEQAELLERIKAEKPLVLSEDFFENIIEVSEFPGPKKFSVQESAAALNAYFNVLQNLFEKKGRAVSISNASENASVIGLVRSVLHDGFELEDQTGAIKTVSKAQVDEDDVVMVAGKVIQKVLYADYVEFPDAPERQARKSPKKCDVLFGKRAEGADYSIVFGNGFSMEKKSLTVGKNPALLKINNISVLISPLAAKIAPAQILKKRRLPGTLVPIADAPDIFLLRGAENFLENYKGTAIVAVDGKSLARINLKTGEIKFETEKG
ncbi:MAG: hypothetical protein KKB25_00485 [Nanoarchaeota archaeon]|nr:hypothetical protein [Nanoarchaeota archaeon]